MLSGQSSSAISETPMYIVTIGTMPGCFEAIGFFFFHTGNSCFPVTLYTCIVGHLCLLQYHNLSPNPIATTGPFNSILVHTDPPQLQLFFMYTNLLHLVPNSFLISAHSFQCTVHFNLAHLHPIQIHQSDF